MSGDRAAERRERPPGKRDSAADRRDGAADERDAAADLREAGADERERLADEREAALEHKERRLDVRAAQMDLPPERASAHAERDDASRRRRQDDRVRQVQRLEREQLRHEREVAEEAREEAAERRQASGPPMQLAMTFAELARQLQGSDQVEEVLSRLAWAAVENLAGCHMATVTIRNGNRAFQTVASTHGEAAQVDEAQFRVGEGPCIDGFDEPVVYVPEFPDDRWPALGSGSIDWGVHSVLSFRFIATGPTSGGATVASLNAYAPAADAFDDEAREIGLILAAHASLAAEAVHHRHAFDQLSNDLHRVLLSREVIGQAKGILMERLNITSEEAFDRLRRGSQQMNLKVREIAERIAETGEFDDAVDAG